MLKKVLITALSCVAINPNCYASKPEPCEKQNFDFVKYIAEANGYTWSGTLKTCTAEIDDYGRFVIFQSGPMNRLTISATLWQDPARVQFMKGGGTNLFCVQKRNNEWVNTGINCK